MASSAVDRGGDGCLTRRMKSHFAVSWPRQLDEEICNYNLRFCIF